MMTDCACSLRYGGVIQTAADDRPQAQLSNYHLHYGITSWNVSL
jgi:hypothetical protein